MYIIKCWEGGLAIFVFSWVKGTLLIPPDHYLLWTHEKKTGSSFTAFHYALFIVHTEFHGLTLNCGRRISHWRSGSVYIFGAVFWRPLTGPRLVLRDWNFVRNLSRASLTENKWVDSILLHFFTGLRPYSIVKHLFPPECPNLDQKKECAPIFFLVQHTSADLYWVSNHNSNSGSM